MPKDCSSQAYNRGVATCSSLLATFTAISAVTVTAALVPGQSALAQSSLQTEDSFREVFLTAAYSAAFGAAFGAALLPFFSGQPMDNIRYVTGGASVGFMVGSSVAFYNIARQSQAYPYPAQDSQDGLYGTTQPATDPRLELASAQTLPKGALFVGRDLNFGLSVPRFGVSEKHVEVALAQFEF